MFCPIIIVLIPSQVFTGVVSLNFKTLNTFDGSGINGTTAISLILVIFLTYQCSPAKISHPHVLVLYSVLHFSHVSFHFQTLSLKFLQQKQMLLLIINH
ncbi:Protein of unknown function [Bacillus cytotoxicus]|uniref:Uncharacterized protein n=1 Tax=Bacillus cytotoxicus TaxID=580165 RepID=A0AAX2CFR0_9BACI|nr:Protein of unknown function [Bacillus cytotoxicus]